MKNEALNTGNYYHIYTHAVGGRNLFKEADNYDYFLHQYDRFISPVADTFAWALMPNHVHFLIRVKKDVVYKYSNVDGSMDAVKFNEHKWETIDLSACEAPDKVKIPKAEKHFAHLFNSYARHFNKKYNMRGALFERPFQRKQVENTEYLKRLILYIHNNPVHHGFCSHPVEYPWTSYLTCVSLKPTKLNRDEVLGWFNAMGEFKTKHDEVIDWGDMEDWLQMKE